MSRMIAAMIFPMLLAAALPAGGAQEGGCEDSGFDWQPVAGTGTHYFSTAIIHSSRDTDVGRVQHSAETIDMKGDLVGRVLYQPSSVFDFAKGTLVNTGQQVFSGTVLGYGPSMFFDERFRFEVDLDTGATTGKVYLVSRLPGYVRRCHLDVVGTGKTPEGDATFDYSGRCCLRERADDE